MDENKLGKYQLFSANVNFILGTLFLMQYNGVLSAPDVIPHNIYMALSAATYVCAVFDLIRYMRGGKKNETDKS